MFRRLLPGLVVAASIFCLLPSGFCAFVFDLRPPTPAEQKALTRYTEVINKVLSEFPGDDWSETVDNAFDADLAVNANSDRPLDINEMLQRSYTVDTKSKRFKTFIKPLMEKGMEETDLNIKSEIGAQIQELMHLQVEVHFNVLNSSVDPVPADNPDLKIPGAVFAYKVKNEVTSSGAAYVLFFGDGKASKWDPYTNSYRYTFAHPPGTPFIENVEFRIYGAEDRIQELLHSIDWKQVNGALTPLSPGPTSQP